jgi:hypothetical protein
VYPTTTPWVPLDLPPRTGSSPLTSMRSLPSTMAHPPASLPCPILVRTVHEPPTPQQSQPWSTRAVTLSSLPPRLSVHGHTRVTHVAGSVSSTLPMLFLLLPAASCSRQRQRHQRLLLSRLRPRLLRPRHPRWAFLRSSTIPTGSRCLPLPSR